MRRLASIFILLAFVLSAEGARAQVFFIDVDSLKTNNLQIAVNPPSQSLRLNVAMIRFVPKDKKTNTPPAAATANSLQQLVAALGKSGQVNLLYLGDRDVDWGPGRFTSFESLDRRPAFSRKPEVHATLTNRHFGLALNVRAMPTSPGYVELSWIGSFAWSSSLIDSWAGEKYLLFGMRVAKLLKPGSVYTQTEGDEDEEPAGGINLRGLFKKKKPEDKKGGKPTVQLTEASFLMAEREEVPLHGTQLLHDSEMLAVAIPITPLPNDPPEILFFVIQHKLNDL